MSQNSSHLVLSQQINADEINLLDYWRVILKWKKMIVAIVVSASIMSVITSLIMTKVYRATATLMPISGGSGLSSMVGGLGSLASLAGVSASGNKEEMKIMAILESRNIAENIVNKFDLIKVLFEKSWDEKFGTWKEAPPTMEDAIQTLKGFVKFTSDNKKGLIIITAEHTNPKFAATLANAYIDELQKIINGKSFSMAKRNRIFIESQLKKNKEEFLEAGKTISDFYGKSRVSNVDANLDVSLSNEDVQLRTEGLTDVIDKLTQKKVVVEAQIEKTKVEDVPQQVYLSYLLLRKELITKISAMLTTQYEMSKIEELKEDLAFQVIDNAVVPAKRFKPKRAQICMMAFVASLFFSVFLAFFLEYIAKMKAVTR